MIRNFEVSIAQACDPRNHVSCYSVSISLLDTAIKYKFFNHSMRFLLHGVAIAVSCRINSRGTSTFK